MHASGQHLRQGELSLMSTYAFVIALYLIVLISKETPEIMPEGENGIKEHGVNSS